MSHVLICHSLLEASIALVRVEAGVFTR